MSNFMTSVFTSTVQYITENLSCLTYAGDVIVNKYLIYTSYYDLLVDISEGFGVWVSIVVLTLALLALSVAIHKEESSTTNLPQTKGTPKKSNLANSSSYSSFTRFIASLRNKL
jgi:hypothetical protein